MDREIVDAFETVRKVVREKIQRLCIEHKYIEAEELERALIEINLCGLETLK